MLSNKIRENQQPRLIVVLKIKNETTPVMIR